MADLADLISRPDAFNLQAGSGPIQTAIVLGLLPFIPAALVTLTCFTRIVIVLSFVRQGVGAQQVPPNMVLTGLALFITLFVMQPVFAEIDQKAVQPYLAKQIGPAEALRTATDIHKQFMLRHTRKQDLALFLHLSGNDRVESAADTPYLTAVPAFVISELKTAFVMGFCIYLPFLMVDLVVSSVLTSMGMVMMPPVTVSAPFKILLFVLADGWHLVTHAVAASYG
jgi:flagellar biosynthetic protein FliP